MDRLLQLRSRARDLITGHWTQGAWVEEKLGEDDWYPEGPGNHLVGKVESLRIWLREHEFIGPDGRYIDECHMCPEGAVYLACALDPKATDDTAGKLLSLLEKKLPLLAEEDVAEEGEAVPWPSIPEFNDNSGLGEHKIIKTLFT